MMRRNFLKIFGAGAVTLSGMGAMASAQQRLTLRSKADVVTGAVRKT